MHLRHGNQFQWLLYGTNKATQWCGVSLDLLFKIKNDTKKIYIDTTAH